MFSGIIPSCSIRSAQREGDLLGSALVPPRRAAFWASGKFLNDWYPGKTVQGVSRGDYLSRDGLEELATC